MFEEWTLIIYVSTYNNIDQRHVNIRLALVNHLNPTLCQHCVHVGHILNFV